MPIICRYADISDILLMLTKQEIKIFTIGLQGNYPTIIVDPPVEYLKSKDV